MSGAENLFVDTNVPVYSCDQNEPVKGPVAEALLTQVFSAGRPLLSTQVISEFYWAVTRKIRFPLSDADALTQVKHLKRLTRVVPITWRVLNKAFQAVASHGLPLWDAQVFAAAVLNGASVVLSEDFQHRRTVETVTFLNPFAPDFDVAEILSA